MSFCKICGVKLTPENRYVSGKNKRRYCKTHWSERIKHNLEKRKKKFWLIRGERYTLIFRSQAERREFTTIRRIQQRFGKAKISPSSNVGRSIDEKVFKKTENGELYFIYELVLCNECKGIVRYDSNGYQVCEDCGLIREELTYEQIYDLSLADRAANYNKNDIPVTDRYYSRAYRRA